MCVTIRVADPDKTDKWDLDPDQNEKWDLDPDQNEKLKVGSGSGSKILGSATICYNKLLHFNSQVSPVV